MEFIKQEEDENMEGDEKESIWDEKQFLEVLKHYSDESLIPPDLKKREWSVFGKALINTFLTEKDLPMIDIYSQILRIDEMQSKPAHLLTFEEVNNLDKMNFYLFLNAKRAIGIEGNKMNERTLQNTQIGQQISTQIIGTKKPSGGNIFSRLGRGL